MLDVDFSGVTEYLNEIQKALQAVNGSLGQVKIANVADPADVQRALAELEQIVDRAFSPYIGNPTVHALAEQMKASYKEQMLQRVEAKRREANK